MTIETTPRTAADVEAELMAGHTPGFDEEDDEGEGHRASEAETEAAAAEAAAVSEASRKGWVPKDQYKGDPAKWVDAKTFIERGERFNKNLQREVADLREQLKAFEGTRKAFLKFHEETIAKKDAEIAEAITALRVQRTAAIREGDDEGAVALEDRIDLLKEQREELKKPVEPETPPAEAPKGPNLNDPVIEEWIDDGNQWFKDDPKLRDFAIALGDQMIKDGFKDRGRKFLDKVAERMAEEFPRRFKKQETPPTPNHVEGEGNSNGNRSAGKTARDLPPEDRKLMKQFIAEGWTTEEKFLKSYFSNTK